MFGKSEKILTEWMCNLQSRSFILPIVLGCIFGYIQYWVAKCKLFEFNEFNFVKRKSKVVECKSNVTERKFQMAPYTNSLLDVKVIY